MVEFVWVSKRIPSTSLGVHSWACVTTPSAPLVRVRHRQTCLSTRHFWHWQCISSTRQYIWQRQFGSSTRQSLWHFKATRFLHSCPSYALPLVIEGLLPRDIGLAPINVVFIGAALLTFFSYGDR